VAEKEIAVKKYVVRLDAEERDRLNELIRKGKRSAQLLTKARILLEAPIFYSWSGLTWDKSLILLVVGWHSRESVVPRFARI
jgi:hypothetical protein